MMFKKSLLAAAVLAVCLTLSAGTASAALMYDQTVTAYYGSGNGPDDWTVWQNTDFQLALRTHQRFPTPQNIQNSNGDGTYSWDPGSGTFSWGDTGALWNFDWSVRVPDNSSLDQYTYELGLDYNPGLGTTFHAFDPINPGPADHALIDVAGTVSTGDRNNSSVYDAQIAANIGAQNSWNYGFFDHLFPFDPNAPGIYDIYLSISDGSGEIGRTEIQVLVGGGAPIPEPATMGLLGLGLAGIGLRARRKRA